MNHAIIANHLSEIYTLTWSEYDKCKRDIELMLGLVDLDIVLLEPKPVAPEENSSAAVIAKFEKWEHKNWWSLMLINDLLQIPSW